MTADSIIYCKSCPCCGCNEKAHQTHLERTTPKLVRSFSIKCGKCGMSTPRCKTPEEAADIWNQRETVHARVVNFSVEEFPEEHEVVVTCVSLLGESIELYLSRNEADGLACDIDEAVKTIDTYDPNKVAHEKEIDRIIDEKREH